MKKSNTFLVIILLTALTATSQDTTYTFFDSDWQETPMEDYAYYRKVYKAGKNKWAVLDYYRNGNLQMTGLYNSKRLYKKNGIFTYYYKNGLKKTEYTYVLENKEGPCQGWFKDGTKDFTGFYSNNKMNGEWLWYFNNGPMSAQESYINDSLITYSFWNEDGSEADIKQAMREPYFIGGQDAITHYLDENVNYPMKARIGGFEGEVIVSFTINRTGQVEDVKVIKSVQKWLDREAVRVIVSMPDWIPGIRHNRLERVLFQLPIIFKLN